jgi:hypothetical protein
MTERLSGGESRMSKEAALERFHAVFPAHFVHVPSVASAPDASWLVTFGFAYAASLAPSHRARVDSAGIQYRGIANNEG